MKIAFTILILIHGLIHLMGFSKAFNYAEVSQLTGVYSETTGVFWLIAALLFISAAIMFLSGNALWWAVSIIAILISQIVIIQNWHDARFGTIANIIILVWTIAAFGQWNFNTVFKSDCTLSLKRTAAIENQLLTIEDIAGMPVPVQKYLIYTRAVGNPKITNIRLSFKGRMRSKSLDWFSFKSEQYNFFNIPERLFFMKGKIKGLDVPGYHDFKNGIARMRIKPFGLIPVVNQDGIYLNQAETVTFFNDMCLMAPSTLIDECVTWNPIDDLSAKAHFTCNGITISAILYFNNEGQLVNFISDDRVDVSGDTSKNCRFSTPVKNYVLKNGHMVPSYGEAIWHYPDGEFVYGEFYLDNIEYNVK